ncbi:MAG: hypothetical protein R3276_02600, partial [Marinobacter sp.]|nr:hypothetical protein [Marinobacter sp.]
MAGFRRGGLVLKPLVAMVALANAQIALGCDDILVNAVTDVGGSPDLTTLDEALDAIGACAGGESVQVTIDDSLAGQTLTPIGGMTRSVDSSKQVSITGPSTNLVIVSVDDATWNLRVAESASMELNNLKFVGNPATTRSNALVRVSTN